MRIQGRRTLIGNVVANYAYVFVMGVITLLATPIYVQRLGASQWGLVALCMTAQGVLLLLDAGLGQVMPGQIARAVRSGQAVSVYSMSLRIYGCIALAACALGQLLVPQVAAGLAGPNAALQSDLEVVLRLVLVQFLFQFPNNAALAYWNGTEQQRVANLRQAGFAASKHGMALLLVIGWQPSAMAYMLPFALLSAVEFLANWRKIRADASAHQPHAAAQTLSVRQLLASAGGFSVAVVLGMLTAQMDRLYLARAVSTELFGYYVVVSNLALTLMHLQGPIQRAFLPRIIVAEHALKRMVWQMLGLIALTSVLPCIALASVAEPLLRLWLNNAEIARVGAPVFQLIALAVGLNGLYGGVHTLFIRDNLYARLIVLNLVILVAQFALLSTLVERLSIVAGGAAWLLGCSLQVAYGLVVLLTHRSYQHAATDR